MKAKKQFVICRKYKQINFIFSNLSKMIARPRPQSAIRRPMTAIPNQLNSDYPNPVSTPRNRKQTLANLVPDMPAVIQKDRSSTAFLYSKFIMKGIKTNRIDLVKESFNMKKQNLKYDKKMSLKLMKTMKSTKQSTKNEAIKSQRNEINDRASLLQKSQMTPDESHALNLQINNFFRLNSNRITLQQNTTQRKLSNVQSQKGFQQRPHSAFTTPTRVQRSARAQTANYRRAPNGFNKQYIGDSDDFKPSIPEKNLLKIVEIDGPGMRYTNFLQRNKRQLSAASKKTSIYITNLDGKKSEMEIKKISAKKHKHKKSMPDLNDLNEFNFVREEPLLSKREIADIEQKNKKNVEFMKKHMPNQYKKFIQHVMMQENGEASQGNELVSVNLEQNPNEFGEINLNSKNQDQAMQQANDYFNQYAHICEQTEYHINKKLKKKEIPKSFNEVLHVGHCQELLQLEAQRNQLQANKDSEDLLKRIKQIKERMFEIVKVLSFFKSKSVEVCYKIFSLCFTISTLEEQSTIIKRGDQVKYFHVILNGSVIRQFRNQPNEQSQTLLTEQIAQIQVYTSTLFDGETFGQPDNQAEPTYRHQYKSAQKVLLMSFPYFDYKKICSESQNIEQRIMLLKDIFGSVPGCKSLNNQHLEALAFELQTSTYTAKQVIFRKQDICDKLIIVSSGQISKVNEHILKRAKKNSKDMRKKKRSTTKLKVKDHSIQKLRRDNLKNYEVLNQNEQEFVFYYQDIVKEFIKGDVFNWQGFSHQHRQSLLDQQRGVVTEKTIMMGSRSNSMEFRLDYSLISNTDNTKVYMLTLNRIQHLPEMLKQVIYAKIDDAMKKERPLKTATRLERLTQKLVQSQPANSIQKWDQYKQKICNDILSRKLKV